MESDILNNGEWSLTERIVREDLGENSQFGWTVHLSEDFLLVGAISAVDTYSNKSGAVIMYKLEGNNWRENCRYSIQEDGAAFDYFGYAVSMDEDRVVVGAPNSDGVKKRTGVVNIFDFDETGWRNVQRLSAPDSEEYDEFGYSVSLQGNYIVVGDPFTDNQGGNSGSVYVYELKNYKWHFIQKLIPDEYYEYDNFGISVGIDADTIVVGANRTEVYGDGAVYVFKFNGSEWQQVQKLYAQDGTGGENFGVSVSISDNRILIGDDLDDDLGFNSGSAYIFEYNGNQWIQSKKLLPSKGETRGKFGNSVHISGNQLIIGSENKTVSEYYGAGSAYIFEYNGSSWIESKVLNAQDPHNNDNFGSSVKIINDNVIIGSRLRDEFGVNSGAVYYYNLVDSEWKLMKKFLPGDGGGLDFFGNSVDVFGDKVIIGAYGNNDNGNDSGSAYIFDLSNIDKKKDERNLIMSK